MDRVERYREDALDTPLGLIGGLLMYGGVATLMYFRGWWRSLRGMTPREIRRFFCGILIWAGIMAGIWRLGLFLGFG